MWRLGYVARNEGATLFVPLDHSAGVVEHTDNCPLRSEVRAILRVRNCISDRVGPRVPDRTVSKQVTEQLDTISVLARTYFVKVVGGGQSNAALFRAHGFHTFYLSNELAALKETILLLFDKQSSVALDVFRPFLRPKAGTLIAQIALRGRRPVAYTESNRAQCSARIGMTQVKRSAAHVDHRKIRSQIILAKHAGV